MDKVSSSSETFRLCMDFYYMSRPRVDGCPWAVTTISDHVEMSSAHRPASGLCHIYQCLNDLGLNCLIQDQTLLKHFSEKEFAHMIVRRMRESVPSTPL